MDDLSSEPVPLDPLPRVEQVRVNPDGYVAQRFNWDFNGAGHWVLTFFADSGLQVKVLADEDVADWSELRVAP